MLSLDYRESSPRHAPLSQSVTAVDASNPEPVMTMRTTKRINGAFDIALHQLRQRASEDVTKIETHK